MEKNSSPDELMEAIVPELYKLRMGCTSNVVQRLVSDGLGRWAERNLNSTIVNLTAEGKLGDDERSVLNLIKMEIISEVNVAIFGREFEGFAAIVSFMSKSVKREMEASKNPDKEQVVSVICDLTDRLLGCVEKKTFLERLLQAIPVLRKRIVDVDPWVFTVRVFQRNPLGWNEIPGRRNADQIWRESFKITKLALGRFQVELGHMVSEVERAIVDENDQLIVNIFPLYLGNRTSLLYRVFKQWAKADSTLHEHSGRNHEATTSFTIAEETITPPAVVKTITPAIADQTITPPFVQETITPPIADQTITPPIAQETITPPIANQTITPPIVRETITEYRTP